MRLSDLGEFGLIERFAPQFCRDLPPNALGIGDDCAVLPLSDSESLLMTTDLLIEDIHFLLNKISAWELGFKALAVNLSDIAAMGGTPTAAFLSIGLPQQVEIDWIDSFFAGLHHLSHESNTPLLGGDTTKSADRLVINIAVLGRAAHAAIKYRSTAQVDDIICVTGMLGDSGGGLKLLLSGLPYHNQDDLHYLINAHHRPYPQLKEGAWLAAQPNVHAMIDVSDGIDSDIQRIMEKSGVGARIHVQQLPISQPLHRAAMHCGWNSIQLAATGGEDYCLLCTINPQKMAEIADTFYKAFQKTIYPIGIIESGNQLRYFYQDRLYQLDRHGWDHFKP